MKASYKRNDEAPELPDMCWEEGRFASDERVIVHVELIDVELSAAGSLEGIIDIVSRRTRERKLTEEKFQTTFQTKPRSISGAAFVYSV